MYKLYALNRLIFKILYFLHPLELFKKLYKIILVSKEILLNRISFYPNIVINFEKSFANYVGTNYAITFCNGTSSIEAALFAINIKVNDEVIVPSCNFLASISPIINAGAKPVFVDVDHGSFCVSKEKILEKITPKTKCIIIVHLWGYVVDIEPIIKLAKEKNIFVIEDSSHAHGASLKTKKVGSFGDIGCFSLQGGKAIAGGEAGIAVTDNRDLFYKMSMYGHFNRHSKLFSKDLKKYQYTGLGHKARAHPLAIALASVDLKFSDFYNNKINKNFDKITKLFSKSKSFEVFESLKHSKKGGFFGGLPLMINNEALNYNSVKQVFSNYGISISPYPYELNHKLEVYGNNKITLENTEKLKEKLFLIDRKILVFYSFFFNNSLNKIIEIADRNLKSE